MYQPRAKETPNDRKHADKPHVSWTLGTKIMKKSTLFWNPFLQYATFGVLNIACLAIIAFTGYHMICCQRFFEMTETPFPLLLDTACKIIDPIVCHPWVPSVILISLVIFEILYGKSIKNISDLPYCLY